MSNKITKVLLATKDGKTEREFEINHAERILGMLNNGGWMLPKGSEFQLDKNDGLILRNNKRTPNESNKKADIK